MASFIGLLIGTVVGWLGGYLVGYGTGLAEANRKWVLHQLRSKITDDDEESQRPEVHTYAEADRA